MKRRKITATPTYSLIDEMTASPTQPLPEATRRHQLTRMWAGLASIEKADKPTSDDWRVCSDAVNLMETLTSTNNGWWVDCDGDPVQITDSSGLLQDAITALALSGKRHMTGTAIRLDAQGIQAIRAVLWDYVSVIEQLPARTMIHCHRLTERRIREILSGKKRPHDIEIINL
jgi:hypothetical protein